MSISVLSEDFLKDTNIRDLNEVLRYSASSAGDDRMGILQPATGNTPSGNIALRGFPINSKLRNGIIRQNGFSLDNVERVEIIKGPAAVFFGQGYPGGVINYVTKRPQFSSTPSTSLSYSYGGSGGNTGTQRATLDHNTKLNEKTAFRLVGAWDNGKGDVNYEFNKGFSITPSLTFIPFDSKKIKINLEVEHLDKTRNQDDTAWTWNEQYFLDYQNPRPELITASGVANAAAYRTRIFSSYANWIADVRKAAGDNYIPGVTSIKRGAYYTDRAGNRVYDEDFNYYGVGSYSQDVVTTGQVTIEGSPFEWLDFRYAYTADNSSYYENKSSAVPNADGMTFNTLGSNLFTREYIQDSQDHQIDIVLKADVAGNVQKLLVGGV
ncbi:MAG: TonB-dependent receptor plug domain-containing protein, partial [Nibricoccus sp.]